MNNRMEEEAPTQSKTTFGKPKTCKVPYKFKVTPSKEEGFALRDCMKGFNLDPTEGYEQDSDYYFNSYAHFGIHEEMLKDKVKNTPKLVPMCFRQGH